MNARQKISVQICLRTYFQRWGERKELAGCSTSELRLSEQHRRTSYQINSEPFSVVLCCSTLKDNQGTGGNCRRHLTRVTGTKKVKLQDVDCKSFCCYTAKREIVCRGFNRPTKAGGHVQSQPTSLKGFTLFLCNGHCTSLFRCTHAVIKNYLLVITIAAA